MMYRKMIFFFLKKKKNTCLMLFYDILHISCYLFLNIPLRMCGIKDG
jgi:hypothetical protein